MGIYNRNKPVPKNGPQDATDKDLAFERFRARQAAKRNAATPMTDLARLAAEADRKRRQSGTYTPATHHIRSNNVPPIARIATLAVVSVIGVSAPGAICDKSYGDAKAQSFVEQLGYTDASETGKDTFFAYLHGCGKGDSVLYEFTATAQNGESTELEVCKGIFKGATLRQG